jgi:hypothetical protein
MAILTSILDEAEQMCKLKQEEKTQTHCCAF